MAKTCLCVFGGHSLWGRKNTETKSNNPVKNVFMCFYFGVFSLPKIGELQKGSAEGGFPNLFRFALKTNRNKSEDIGANRSKLEQFRTNQENIQLRPEGRNRSGETRLRGPEVLGPLRGLGIRPLVSVILRGFQPSGSYPQATDKMLHGTQTGKNRKKTGKSEQIEENRGEPSLATPKRGL